MHFWMGHFIVGGGFHASCHLIVIIECWFASFCLSGAEQSGEAFRITVGFDHTSEHRGK